MRPLLIAALLIPLAACRFEKLKSGDTTRGGVEPGPGLPSCGISVHSRVAEDGLGLLRIGSTLESIRSSCAIIGEQVNDSATGTASIDLGRDTAVVQLQQGNITRITLRHQAYRTADSLGVGTHISTLMQLRDAAGLTEGNRLYAVSPAVCGLRFMMADPAPERPAAQSGRAALRRLAGETRTRELEIVGCTHRR